MKTITITLKSPVNRIMTREAILGVVREVSMGERMVVRNSPSRVKRPQNSFTPSAIQVYPALGIATAKVSARVAGSVVRELKKNPLFAKVVVDEGPIKLVQPIVTQGLTAGL